MHRLFRLAVVTVAAGAALLPGSAVRAQDEARPVVIGSNRLFLIRSGDTLNGKEWSAQDRINHIQDVYAKYLGGQVGKFTWKPIGDRVHIYLNGEFVLAVTPADAQATGYKSSGQLAPIWVKGLQKGFDATHRIPTGAKH